jgi:hypothetical protein
MLQSTSGRSAGDDMPSEMVAGPTRTYAPHSLAAMVIIGAMIIYLILSDQRQ